MQSNGYFLISDFRSTSLTSEPTSLTSGGSSSSSSERTAVGGGRGWARSTLSKIIRAKSTAGGECTTSSSLSGCGTGGAAAFSPCLSRKNNHNNHYNGNSNSKSSSSSNRQQQQQQQSKSAEGSHIDICVLPLVKLESLYDPSFIINYLQRLFLFLFFFYSCSPGRHQRHHLMHPLGVHSVATTLSNYKLLAVAVDRHHLVSNSCSHISRNRCSCSLLSSSSSSSTFLFENVEDR